jgi:hypothetical protein
MQKNNLDSNESTERVASFYLFIFVNENKGKKSQGRGGEEAVTRG